jgi:hypothetical protein
MYGKSFDVVPEYLINVKKIRLFEVKSNRRRLRVNKIVGDSKSGVTVKPIMIMNKDKKKVSESILLGHR